MNNLSPEFQSLAHTLEGIEMANQAPTTADKTPTLRDLFAGAALAGTMAKMASTTMPSGTRDQLAKLAYQMGDSMLAERDKGVQS